MFYWLKAAAVRCDDYLPRYGVYAYWCVTPVGLSLRMKSGGTELNRLVSWQEIQSARTDPLYIAEQYALQGVSD